MEIRACMPSDINAVQAIYAYHVRTGLGTFEEEPPSVTEMHARFDAIEACNYPFLVAEIDARIVGYACAGAFRPRPAYRYSCESSVYVAEDRQRRGIGSALMLHLITSCRDLGHCQMLAVIGDSGNLASIGLHAAIGFESVGKFRNVGFKFGRWVDVILMQRALTSQQ